MKRKLPRRLSCDENSPYFHPFYFEVGVRINCITITGCVEYDVDGGWARVYAKDGKGKLIKNGDEWRITTVKGKIEPYWN